MNIALAAATTTVPALAWVILGLVAAGVVVYFATKKSSSSTPVTPTPPVTPVPTSVAPTPLPTSTASGGNFTVTVTVLGDSDNSSTQVLDASSPTGGQWAGVSAGTHTLGETPGSHTLINWSNATGGVSIVSGQFTSQCVVQVTGNGGITVNYD